MKKHILLTRPRSSSERWASLLARHGFDCLVEPLLTIEPTHAPRPQSDFQAVLITSANAPDTLDVLGDHLTDLLTLPCFCVGASTGEAARTLGFTNIHCGHSDSGELAQKIIETLSDTTRPLLHIAGDVVDGKASASLSQKGFTVTPWTVYHATAVEDFTPATLNAFKSGEIALIPVFSPRSARILVSIIQKNCLTRACPTIAALALSQAVATVLQTLPWRHLHIAKSPAEDDVLACLQKEMSAMSNDIPLPPPQHAPKPARPLSGFIKASLTAALLLGVASVAFVECPYFLPVPAAPAADATIAKLEKRIATLETRVQSLSETPAPAPVIQASGPDAQTTETLTNLQNQISHLQDQGKNDQQSARKLMAAAFAFVDLRDAAKNGHSFAPAFTALQNAVSDDVILATQIAKLSPFATQSIPTLAQLHADLLTQEATLPVNETPKTNPTWQERIEAVFQKLVSVRPLHNPEFATLEQALLNGDAAAANDNFKVLPTATQNKLSAWQSKLANRTALDAAIQDVANALSAPATKENNL